MGGVGLHCASGGILVSSPALTITGKAKKAAAAIIRTHPFICVI
jgi:hypothetical protein